MFLHDPKYNGISFTNDNIEKLTGLSQFDIFSLMGLVRIVDEKQAENLPTLIKPWVRGKYPKLRLTIKCKFVYGSSESVKIHMTREINIKTLIIENEYFRCTPTGTGLGKEIFDCQIDSATALGFKALQCLAYGTPSELDKYQGSHVWAKWGYIEIRKSDIEYFNQELGKLREIELQACKLKNIEPNIPDALYSKDIWELLSTAEGKKIWDSICISWRGSFDLDSNSLSRKRWQIIKDQNKNNPHRQVAKIIDLNNL